MRVTHRAQIKWLDVPGRVTGNVYLFLQGIQQSKEQWSGALYTRAISGLKCLPFSFQSIYG